MCCRLLPILTCGLLLGAAGPAAAAPAPFEVLPLLPGDEADQVVGFVGAPIGDLRLVRLVDGAVEVLAPRSGLPAGEPALEVIATHPVVALASPGEALPQPKRSHRQNLELIVADVDADGHDDILARSRSGLRPFLYLAGRADGGYDEVSDARIGPAPHRRVGMLVPADLDADGDLDLLMVPSHDRQIGRIISDGLETIRHPYQVFVNDGRGRFDEVHSLPSTGPYPNAVVVLDLEADGRPELWISNDVGLVYYRDAIFSPAEPGAAWPLDDRYAALVAADRGRWGMGLDAAWVAPGLPLRVHHANIGADVALTRGADGRFRPDVDAAGAEAAFDDVGFRTKWSPLYADLDLDGVEDLVVCGVGVGMEAAGVPDALYEGLLVHRGRPDGRMAALPDSARLLVDLGVHTVEPVEIDGDGRVDLVAYSLFGERFALLNRMPAQGHFVVVSLRPRGAAAPAGAVLSATCGGRTWRRMAKDCAGAQGCFRRWLHVGLGDCAGPVDLHVRWPSGAEQSFDGVTVGSLITAVEPAAPSPPPAATPRFRAWLRHDAGAADRSGVILFALPGVAPDAAPRIKVSLHGATADAALVHLEDDRWRLPVIFGAAGETVRAVVALDGTTLGDFELGEVGEPCREIWSRGVWVPGFDIFDDPAHPRIDPVAGQVIIERLFAGARGDLDCPLGDVAATLPSGAALEVEGGSQGAYAALRVSPPPEGSVVATVDGSSAAAFTFSGHLTPLPRTADALLAAIDPQLSSVHPIHWVRADGDDVAPLVVTLHTRAGARLDASALARYPVGLRCDGGLRHEVAGPLLPATPRVPVLWVRAGTEVGDHVCEVLVDGEPTGVAEVVPTYAAAPPAAVAPANSALAVRRHGAGSWLVTALARDTAGNLLASGADLALAAAGPVTVEPLRYVGRGRYGAVVRAAGAGVALLELVADGEATGVRAAVFAWPSLPTWLGTLAAARPVARAELPQAAAVSAPRGVTARRPSPPRSPASDSADGADARTAWHPSPASWWRWLLWWLLTT